MLPRHAALSSDNCCSILEEFDVMIKENIQESKRFKPPVEQEK